MFTLFPFTVCNVAGYPDIRNEFLKVKPTDMMWYELDVEIKAQTSVVFHVYDMYDNVHGGRGDLIASLPAKVDHSLFLPLIIEEAACLAKDLQVKELMEAENKIAADRTAAILLFNNVKE